MNNNQYYNQFPQPQSNNTALASFLFGIGSFFFNPIYLVSIAAIIFSIFGMSGNKPSKELAIAGLMLGIISAVLGFSIDLLFTVFSFGLGCCSFFI